MWMGLRALKRAHMLCRLVMLLGTVWVSLRLASPLAIRNKLVLLQDTDRDRQFIKGFKGVITADS